MCVKFPDSHNCFSNSLNPNDSIQSVRKVYIFLSLIRYKLWIMPLLQQWNTFCLYASMTHLSIIKEEKVKKLLRVVSTIFILSLTANAEAAIGKNMILLDNNQLLKVEARGTDKVLRVNFENPKIILWDEEFIKNNNTQLDNQNKSSTVINNTHYFGYETDNATFR